MTIQDVLGVLKRTGYVAAVVAASSATAQGGLSLERVDVFGRIDRSVLLLDQPSGAGSRTGLTARELPASVDAVSARTILERGDYFVRDAITRTTGLTDIASPGDGGMSFSARGFTGVNSVGLAEDGARLAVAAGTQTYPTDSWGYDRIEVLRGPASVVFGNGTVGATINAVRKSPRREAGVEGLVGVGDHGSARLGVGLVCAVFALAWLTSGLLSMNPGAVFSDRSPTAAQLRAWRGGSLDDPSVRRALAAPLPPARSAVELEWWPDGDPEVGEAGVRVAARVGPQAHQLWRRSADAAGWSAQTVGRPEIARRGDRWVAMSGAASAFAIERLAADDLYHYGRFESAPPIWRVHLADAGATWLHVDARSGELLARLDRSNRVQRWTYQGLHSWDFAVLLRHRPLWDLLMLPALGLGLLFSVTSVVVAVQHLASMRRRGQSRTGAPAREQASQPTAS